MSRKIPKLTLRQGVREKTPPPLVKWDLNELERERWEALTAHKKALTKKDITTQIEYEDKETNYYLNEIEFPPKIENFDNETSEFYQKKPMRNLSANKSLNLSSQFKETLTVESNNSIHRPLLMPTLEVEQSEYLPQARSMLERAERNAATEAIDQNSLRFQIKVRRNIEIIHEEDLKQREEQWKEKISKTRESLEKLKKRNRELEEVMKKYLVKKGNESEGSKEISRLIELKSKASDEINEYILKKTDLEKKINELHQDLERITFNFEAKEKTLEHELEMLKKQVLMSENEKVDSVGLTKENLSKRKEDLLNHKQELINKWQSENQDFKEIFEKSDQKKMEIKQQLKLLKTEKEMLKNEKEVLNSKEAYFTQEKEVAENNKKTLKLYNSFQEPMMLTNLELFKEIIAKTAEKITKDSELDLDIQTKNEYSEYMLNIKKLHNKRKEELQQNSASQVEILFKQIKEEELKKTRSTSNLAALKKFLAK